MIEVNMQVILWKIEGKEVASKIKLINGTSTYYRYVHIQYKFLVTRIPIYIQTTFTKQINAYYV